MSGGAQIQIGRLSPLRIVFSLYTASILLEMVEHWDYPIATVTLLTLGALALRWLTRATMLIFLGAATVYFLAFRFPEVANHVNLILFVNVAIIGAVLHSFAVERAFDEARFYDRLAPVLRLSIVATFSVAGFHKLNRDFIDPAVSCIGDFGYDIWNALRADVFGVGAPTLLVAAPILVGAALVFVRERRRDFVLPPIDMKAILAPLAAVGATAAVLVATTGGAFLDSGRNTAVFLIAVVVLCWQLVEGPLLLFRRFQWVALLLSLAVHAQLAMIRIVDFQAVALALLAAFVPTHMWAVWRDAALLRLGRLRFDRLQVYLLLNVVVGGALMLLHHRGPAPVAQPFALTGLLFNLSVLVMIWPFLSGLFARTRAWRWEGAPVLTGATPRVLFAAPVFIVLFGMTSHLGLRTTGNFSMFSNLRTEGGEANHLLLKPLKLAGYQDDLVHILAIDDAGAEIGHHYTPLKGKSLPAVEFRKLLYLWREDGRTVAATVRHAGQTRTYADIATHPDWRVDRWDWEMRLLDFRVVQDGGANMCRW